MRQRDDQPFAIALNNMASFQMSSDDISILRTRISDESQVPNDAITFSQAIRTQIGTIGRS